MPMGCKSYCQNTRKPRDVRVDGKACWRDAIALIFWSRSWLFCHVCEPRPSLEWPRFLSIGRVTSDLLLIASTVHSWQMACRPQIVLTVPSCSPSTPLRLAENSLTLPPAGKPGYQQCRDESSYKLDCIWSIHRFEMLFIQPTSPSVACDRILLHTLELDDHRLSLPLPSWMASRRYFNLAAMSMFLPLT